MSQQEDNDEFNLNDFRDDSGGGPQQQQQQQQSSHPSDSDRRPSSDRPLLTPYCSLDYDFYEDMDERDSIYLDAVSLTSEGAANRKSLYLSRQTVYHSAEELPLDALTTGTTVGGNGAPKGITATTESLLNDSRANGGLPNLPYEPRPGSGPSSIGGGILKRPGMTTKYNAEVPTHALYEFPSITTTTTTISTTSSNCPSISTNTDRKHEPRQIVTYLLWRNRVNATFLLL